MTKQEIVFEKRLIRALKTALAKAKEEKQELRRLQGQKWALQRKLDEIRRSSEEFTG